MNFDELAIYFEENWGKEYSEIYLQTLHNRKVWDHLNKLSKDDCRNVVLKFLNDFRCRISYKCSSELMNQCKLAFPYFEALKYEKLSTINFYKTVVVNNKKMRIIEVIIEIFSILSKVTRIKATATSKMMHMTNYGLFVMWDEGIAENYGFSNDEKGHGYINFLMKMKIELKDLEKELGSLSEEKMASHTFVKDFPPTQLLDIYNFGRRDNWSSSINFKSPILTHLK